MFHTMSVLLPNRSVTDSKHTKNVCEAVGRGEGRRNKACAHADIKGTHTYSLTRTHSDTQTQHTHTETYTHNIDMRMQTRTHRQRNA